MCTPRSCLLARRRRTASGMAPMPICSVAPSSTSRATCAPMALSTNVGAAASCGRRSEWMNASMHKGADEQRDPSGAVAILGGNEWRRSQGMQGGITSRLAKCDADRGLVQCKRRIVIDQQQEIRLDSQAPTHDTDAVQVEGCWIRSGEQNRKPRDHRRGQPAEQEKQQKH